MNFPLNNGNLGCFLSWSSFFVPAIEYNSLLIHKSELTNNLCSLPNNLFTGYEFEHTKKYNKRENEFSPNDHKNSEERLLQNIKMKKSQKFLNTRKKQRIKIVYQNKRRNWTKGEDQKLKNLVEKLNFDWKKISSFFQDRSKFQIKEHYQNYLDPKLNHNAWTKKQDQKLKSLTEQYGRNWKRIALQFPDRSEGKIRSRFFGSIQKKQEKQKMSLKLGLMSNDCLKIFAISELALFMIFFNEWLQYGLAF